MFMIHLCLLLCCVYVVLCWFFTSLVYVRLLASDLVPIDEALWVYLTHDESVDLGIFLSHDFQTIHWFIIWKEHERTIFRVFPGFPIKIKDFFYKDPTFAETSFTPPAIKRDNGTSHFLNS